MGSEAGFQAQYGDTIEIEVGDVMVVCRSMKLSEAAVWMRHLHAAQKGDAESQIAILAEFPAAIGAEEQLEGLLPAEIYEVVRAFFTRQRFGHRNGDRKAESDRSTSDSTTSSESTPEPTAESLPTT